MFDHIGIHVHDLDAAIRFYSAALASLGHVVGSRDATSAGIGPKDAPALWLYASKTKATGVHLAFKTTKRAHVDRFHAAGLEAGGTDNGAPGPRKDYSPTYYAAFLIDPDGNNVEVVCTD